MSFSYHNLPELLEQWGKREQCLPPHHETLKATILNTTVTERATLEHSTFGRRPWLTIICASLAVIVFFVSRNITPPIVSPLSSVVPMNRLDSVNQGVEDLGIQYAQYPMQATGLSYTDFPAPIRYLNSAIKTIDGLFHPAPVSDTREFLKTDYHATIQTRQAEELARRIQTMVRGYGGRIDSASVDPRFGDISFVLPKTSLEAFRDELKTLTPARFLTEAVRMDNLLPQKRVIEESTDETNQTLAILKRDRQTLVNSHNKIIAGWQQRLAIIAETGRALDQELINSPSQQYEIEARKNELLVEQRGLEQQLVQENVRFNSRLNGFDVQTRNVKTQLSSLEKQDQSVLDTVATVQGSVSLRWISLFGITNLYLPYYWPSLFLLILGVITYFSYRRRNILELP